MRIGTRGSALALAQAGQVAGLLEGEHELVTVVTAGDRGEVAGDKERWVRELDAALLTGEIDVAVHSAKDVPAHLPDGIAIAAAPARADARDALCGADGLRALAEGARVGTSSLRREAQLRALRQDLVIVGLRGNVDTRLRRLGDGELDAIVLALAGLQRLGRADAAGAVLDELVPAAGQGVLALATRSDDASARGAVAGVADPATMACLAAERALVRALDADCHTPVGAHAVPMGGAVGGVGGEGVLAVGAPPGGLRLTAFVGRPDGSAWVRDELAGADPEALGAQVSERLLAAGAAEVLGR